MQTQPHNTIFSFDSGSEPTINQTYHTIHYTSHHQFSNQYHDQTTSQMKSKLHTGSPNWNTSSLSQSKNPSQAHIFATATTCSTSTAYPSVVCVISTAYSSNSSALSVASAAASSAISIIKACITYIAYTTSKISTCLRPIYVLNKNDMVAEVEAIQRLLNECFWFRQAWCWSYEYFPFSRYQSL